jgi:hypothetical protein
LEYGCLAARGPYRIGRVDTSSSNRSCGHANGKLLTAGVRPRTSPRRDITVCLLLLLFTIVVRFPYFFPSVISWDESTFILLGQSIVDGHLPYTEFWDNKPPLAFVPFSVFILLFGKSIVGIRIGGALMVFLSAWITFHIGRRIWGYRAGLLAAVATIFFISIAEAGQATMTEIIACAPMMGSLALLLHSRPRLWESLSAGILMALAMLVRLNLAYLALAVGLLLIVRSIRNPREIKALPLYALGGVIPFAGVALVYYLSGHFGMLIKSMIEASMAHATGRFPLSQVVLGQIRAMVRYLGLAPLWVGFVGGVVMILTKWAGMGEEKKRGIVSAGVFVLGVAISILLSGAPYAHYQIQVIPLVALAAGLFYAAILGARRKRRAAVFAFALLVVLLFPVRTIVAAYLDLGGKLVHRRPLAGDTGYELAEYLERENPQAEPTYLMSYHIAYWLTGTKPLSGLVAHPSTIGKPYFLEILVGPGATTSGELEKLLRKEPLFIVKDEDLWYLRRHTDAVRILEHTLASDYTLVKRIGRTLVYRKHRTSSSPGSTALPSPQSEVTGCPAQFPCPAGSRSLKCL